MVLEMEVAKDTGKQEKRRMAVRGAGKGGVGGMAVWGGVAVVAASILVASVSAFKSWRKNQEKATPEPDELNKVNEADTPSTEYDTWPLEIIGKMSEDKLDHENEAPNKDDEKNAEEVANNTITQKHQLAKNQINDKEGVVIKERIIALPKTTYGESDSVQGNDFVENVVKKGEDLAEEIEVDTPMSNGHEYESDENCSIDEIVEKQREHVHDEENGEAAKKNTYLQQVEKLQEESNDKENLEGEEPVVEKENVHEEVENEYEGKVLLENEEDLSETNEEEESEENSEGAGDSSIELNDDKIWPSETMDDILMEIKKSETDNQIFEEKADENLKVEKEQKSLKADSNYATDNREIEDPGKSGISSRKRYMKELLLDLLSKRILVWALAVLVLALAAPLVLSPEGIMKLSIVTFFVVSVSRVLKTII